jgi:hypothetical protein
MYNVIPTAEASEELCRAFEVLAGVARPGHRAPVL